MNCPFCNKELILSEDNLFYHSLDSNNDHHFYSIIIENGSIIEEFYANELSNIELILEYNKNIFNIIQLDENIYGNEILNVSGQINNKTIIDIYNRIINLKVFS